MYHCSEYWKMVDYTGSRFLLFCVSKNLNEPNPRSEITSINQLMLICADLYPAKSMHRSRNLHKSFLKLCMSENCISEVCSSQGPGVLKSYHYLTNVWPIHLGTDIFLLRHKLLSKPSTYLWYSLIDFDTVSQNSAYVALVL